MAKLGDKAIVIGRSMGGLAAAAALAQSFPEVIVLDRDPYAPNGEEPRAGVGQGHHLHALQKGGEDSIERLLPGTKQELRDAGANTFNQSLDAHFYDHGHWHPIRDVGFVNLAATRWLFEGVVRNRLLREPGVGILGERTYESLLREPDGRVVGVVARGPEGTSEEHRADLVVDCTGRGSRTPSLLAAQGAGDVPQFRINMGISYTSAIFEAPADALGPHKTLIVLPAPPNKRGAFVGPIEGGRWLVSLHTRFEKDLPGSYESMLAFASTIEVPDVAEFLRKATIAGPVRSYRKSEALWRRYDKLDSFPDGLLVLGDAIASFNPVYGQGMSAAWLQACALADLLSRRIADNRGLDGLAAEYFPEAMQISREAWNGSTLVDAAYEEVTGDVRPGTEQGIVIMQGLRKLLAEDEELHRDYLGVGQMISPASRLMTPDRLARAMAAISN